MRKFLLLLVIFQLMLLTYSKAETVVYKTYESYATGSGEIMGEAVKVNFTAIMGVKNVSLTFIDLNGNEVKYKPGQIWGYSYKGSLFRFDNRGDIVYLANSTNICFYLNGYGRMNLINENKVDSNSAEIRFNRKLGPFTSGYGYYLSNDIKGEIYPLPILCQGCRNGQGVAPGNYYRDFKDEFPQHQDLYDCFDESKMWERVDCINEYQKAIKKKKK